MKGALLTTIIQVEPDVVAVRQRTREIAALLGFDRQDQTRIATAVSEIARNAFQYARGGRAEFSVTEHEGGSYFEIRITDRGPGIPRLDDILGGRYQSTTGMGLGVVGAKRLMDVFEVSTSSDQGTSVRIGKRIPLTADGRRVGPEEIRKVGEKLAASTDASGAAPLHELREQNQELLRALDALQSKQQQLTELNRELEDTNHGVVALYAELDEKAEALRRANSIKTRFLSNMTHEFRTPLNSLLQLTRLLLDRADGELTSEQEKQVSLIRNAASHLWEMVNDLLDLAKVEAGKIAVRAEEFALPDLLGSLRGLMKPLIACNSEVSLVFEEVVGLPPVFSDEAKISQIVRNFVSNALKFTERGTVTVRAASLEDGWFRISVVDTGIGISAEEQAKIFDDFYQVESALQRKHKGTGLGLPLTQKLAQLLGGRVEVESDPGKGSTFSVILPLRYEGSEVASYVDAGTTPALPVPGLRQKPAAAVVTGEGPARLLLVDDREEDRYFLRSVLLSQFDCTVYEASNGHEGLEAAEKIDPAVIFIDLGMPHMDGFELLERIRANAKLRAKPVIVHSGTEFADGDRDRLSSAFAILSKTALSEEELIFAVSEALKKLGLRMKAKPPMASSAARPSSR